MTLELLRRNPPQIAHEVAHFPRKRLIDFLTERHNPNGRYFIPSNFGQPFQYGFVPMHSVYLDSDLIKQKTISLREVRDRSCTLVTNYSGVIQDDLVPHLYDFLATAEEISRNAIITVQGQN